MGTVRRSRLLPVLLFVMAAIVLGAPTAASAVNVGDTFTAGIPAVTYKVTSATTVQVGDGFNTAVSKTTAGALTIPSTVDKDGTTFNVTAIGDQAFFECTFLTAISIPSSVISIGDRAFEECIALSTVSVAPGLKTIGARAFSGCLALTSFTIPITVDTIGSYALNNCISLTSVQFSAPSSLAAIPEGMFASCTALSTISMPVTVTSIGDYAFSGCDKLASIAVPNNVTSIGEAAFRNCIALKTATIGTKVASIGNRAFQGCVLLTGVSLPGSVTSIGDEAFRDCQSLTGVTIPSSVPGLGNSVFRGCVKLASVTIPNTLTSIGPYAFAYCSALPAITIPVSVTSIGERAFYNCGKLTSVTVPGTVTSIGELAFNTVQQSSLSGVSTSYPFTGSPVTVPISPVLATGAAIPGAGVTVTYDKNTPAGQATVTVKGNSPYTGTVSTTFQITAVPLTAATIELSPSSYVYTGAAIKPVPKVILGAKTLTSNDYTASYSNNTAVGTATITVTGKGNYSGTASETFQITQASLAGATIAGIATNYAHTGSAIKPVPQVVLGGRTLPSSDYTVTYANNINGDTATITVTGKGNCTGTATKTFSIVSPATVVGKITAAYGGAAMSGATVTLGGRTTTTASNGTFSFSGLTPGTYTVTVKKSRYVTKTIKVPVSVGARVTANTTLSRDVKKASIARKPNVSKITYTRKRGVAKFTLSSTMKGWGGKALSKRTVYLQTSKNGKTWKSTYKLKTSATGKVSKVFKIKTKQVRYYRWYVPSKSQVNLKTYSPLTKVTVK